MIGKETKVLFLPAWFPSCSNQVLGIFVKHHALALNSSVNLAVLHICPHPDLNRLSKFEKSSEEGFLVYRNYHFHFSFKLFRPLNWLIYFFAAVLGYIKVIRDFGRPDFIHVHVLTRAGLIALLAKFLFNTPYCISEHWSRYLPERNSYHGFLRKILTKLIIKNSRGISTVSRNLKQSLQRHKLDHQNFMVIPNTINFDFFTPGTISHSRADFRFIHVSGLTDSSKNVSGIIKACHILKNEGINVRLNLVGDSSGKQDLIELVNKLDMSDRICFSGELRGEELVGAYHKADAFVLFSNFENQPCVLLEAFSVGIPVIATEVGGVAEIVNSCNGLLTAPSDYRLLAEKMKTLMLDIGKYNSDLIRSEAEQKFDYPKVRDQFIEFYTKSFCRS